MPVTADIYIPPDSELTVQEVNLSGAALRAGAFHLGKYCEFQNNEFLLCRREMDDPRKCVNEGKDVTSCSLDFFRKIKKSCFDEFTQHADCLNRSSGHFAYDKCRNTQSVFDACVLNNLNLERPPFDYYNQVRVHVSPRPKPPPPKPDVFPDPTPKLPDDYPREPAKYGSRFHWLN